MSEIKTLLMRASDDAASAPFDAADDLLRGHVARRRRRLAGVIVAVATALAVPAVLVVVRDAIERAPAVAPAVPRPAVTQPAQPTHPASPRRAEELLIGGRTTDSLELPYVCELPRTAFSPDGERAAVACDTKTVVIDLPDGKPRRVADGAKGLAWTADGTRLVLVQGSSLEVVTPDTPAIPTGTTPLPDGWYATSVDLDQAGRAVLGGRIGEDTAIMAIDLDGAHPTLVGTYATFTALEPRWSPDGSRIGYLRLSTPWTSGRVGDVSVWTMTADGRDPRLVLAEGRAGFIGAVPGFDWSPAGRMAFTTGSSAGMVIVLTDTNGRRTETRTGMGPLAWRPAS